MLLGILMIMLPLAISGCGGNDFDTALELFENEQYVEALAVLERVPLDYQNTSELLPYFEAYAYFEQGNYPAAAEVFASLGNFRTSADMANESLYNHAMHLLNMGAYGEAFGVFASLGEFRDSEEMLLEVRYRRGLELLEAGEFSEAAERFAALSGYRDADQLLRQSSYRHGHELLSRADYAGADTAFGRAQGYGTSETMQLESRYRRAMQLFEAGDFASAETLLRQLGDYRDSAEMLQQAAGRQINERALYDAYLANRLRQTREWGYRNIRIYSQRMFDIDGDGIQELIYTISDDHNENIQVTGIATIRNGEVYSLLSGSSSTSSAGRGVNNWVGVEWSNLRGRYVLYNMHGKRFPGWGWFDEDDEGDPGSTRFYLLNNGQLTLIETRVNDWD